MRLFGWSVTRDPDENENLKSVVPERTDGAIVVDQSNSSESATGWDGGGAFAYSMSFDLDAEAISEHALISKYREMSLVPEVEFAIEDIFNAIAATDEDDIVDIDLDKVNYTQKMKDTIAEEFQHVLKKLNFNSDAYRIIRRWYIDGRLFYQVVVDETKFKEEGIGKLTYIDPRLIKKVRVVKKEMDQRTGIDTFYDRNEYYLFSPHGFGSNLNTTNTINTVNQGVQLSKDSVVYVHSGLLNPSNTIVLSYLHKAIRPLNQLKSLEDAAIIYRLSRAPERRVFYIDVGNLPPAKAEQVLQRQMQQYRSKMVYDSTTGGLRSDPKQMTMIEDYWLPRRGDGKATEITTLPGGQNLGEMEEVNYFLNKLYKSLNVPISRLDPQAGFNFGRVTEINRDEVKFMKFIGRLRKEFSVLFLELLKRQLSLKNILDEEDFEEIKQNIAFKFKSDNIFEESKNNEILSGRFDVLQRAENAVGVYISKDWVRRNILQQTDEEIEEIEMQIAQEIEGGHMDNEIETRASEMSDDFNQQMVKQQEALGKAAAAQGSQIQAATIAKQAPAVKLPVTVKPSPIAKNDK